MGGQKCSSNFFGGMPMTAPKISVVIPMYNAERFIRQCLISVLSSKFTDYEVIVVDDCSTDSGVAEVEKLVPHFKRGGAKTFFDANEFGRTGYTAKCRHQTRGGQVHNLH